VLLILIACQKQLSFIVETPAPPPPPPPIVNKCRLIRTVQGTGISDTTINFHYDNNNYLSFIENTSYQDTVRLLYTNTSLLGLDRTHAGPVSVEYNIANKPVRVESYGNKYIAEYKNDTVLTKITAYYPDNNTWKIWRYYMFEFNPDNNMKTVTEYTTSNAVSGHLVVEYSELQNFLSSMELVNFENYVSINDVIPLSQFLSSPSKLIKSLSSTGFNKLDYRNEMKYETDSNKNVISSQVTVFEMPSNLPIGMYTRKYYYECN
jgi:hypothetical protein